MLEYSAALPHQLNSVYIKGATVEAHANKDLPLRLLTTYDFFRTPHLITITMPLFKSKVGVEKVCPYARSEADIREL